MIRTETQHRLEPNQSWKCKLFSSPSSRKLGEGRGRDSDLGAAPTAATLVCDEGIISGTCTSMGHRYGESQQAQTTSSTFLVLKARPMWLCWTQGPLGASRLLGACFRLL